MEAVASIGTTAESRERLFFPAMAIVLAVTVVTAFSLFLAAGIFHLPFALRAYVHAGTFMTWIGFYVLDNTLVFRNRHRPALQVGSDRRRLCHMDGAGGAGA